MSIVTETKMRALRIVWVLRLDSAFRMTSVDEPLLAGRVRVEAERHGR